MVGSKLKLDRKPSRREAPRLPVLCSEGLSPALPLVKQDLLKHTPSSHPDYLLLQDALRISQNFLSSINEEITPRRQSMTVQKGEVSAQLAPGTRLPNEVGCLLPG